MGLESVVISLYLMTKTVSRLRSIFLLGRMYNGVSIKVALELLPMEQELNPRSTP